MLKQQAAIFDPVARETLVCLLASEADEQLYPLTLNRAKPAVPFGGIYRIIDVTLSNCVNSGLRRIFVVTQYRALSLIRHIREGWAILPRELDEYVEILPPMQRLSKNWYQGTADAIYQNLYSVGGERCKYVLVLLGDHVYKMDYQKMLKQHAQSEAEVTLGTIECDRLESSRLGVIDVNTSGRITGWHQKPAAAPAHREDPNKRRAPMGIYCFNRDLLIQAMCADAENPGSSHDLGSDVIPKLIETHRVDVYDFVDENKKEARYWRDFGTIEAYYEANMDLVAPSPVFNLYDKEWPIRTYQQQYPPAKFVFAETGRRMGVAVDSIVSMGSIISGGGVSNSILSPGARINSFAEVNSSILFSNVDIGRHSRIRRAIIDSNVRIPEHAEIGYNLEEDRKKYHVTRAGIVVVVPEQRGLPEGSSEVRERSVQSTDLRRVTHG